ncbi:MAG: septum site-determining protein MinC [Cyanobacteria bacterium P01_A01_bin.45]
MTSDSANPDIKLQSASTDVEKANVEKADVKKTKIEETTVVEKKDKLVSEQKSEEENTSDVQKSILPNSGTIDSSVSSVSQLEEIDILGELPKNISQKNIQVQLKSENGKLLMILPTEAQLDASEVSWSDIWQQIQIRLSANERLLSTNTNLHLMASDRLLDGRQLQQLEQVLRESNINLVSVSTSRRQTAIAAVSAGYSVEQIKAKSLFNSQEETATANIDALYLETTVRSGVDIRHSGSITILGDVNPGGSIIADGDILVWGRLRGLAHAGANGNRQCLIMALQMEPTQIRIADAVARAPEKSLTQSYPEVAYVTPEGMRISKATDFSRSVIRSLEPDSSSKDSSSQLNDAQLLSEEMRKKDIGEID